MVCTYLFDHISIIFFYVYLLFFISEEQTGIPDLAHEAKKSDSMNAVKDFVAGGVGGIMQLVTGHPLDTVKVKLQTGGGEYSGIVDVCKKTMKADGFVGFYKGVASPFIGFTALNAILFSAYGVGGKIFRGNTPEGEELSYSKIFMAGMFAGSQSSFVESPMDLFKAKMQSQKPDINGKLEYKSTLDCVVQVYILIFFLFLLNGLVLNDDNILFIL